MNSSARQMALGGMMTAVALVIMCMGSIIPVNTYVCPVLCILITRVLLGRCGRRIAWCYYAAVAILGLLLAPDKEAAMVYAFLGYYPMVKPWLERIRPRVLRMAAKLALFTLAGGAAYWVLLAVLGLPGLQEEFQEMGTWMGVVLIFMWDILFLLVDRLLEMKFKRKA